jgi:CelD/BcsL family acetyltransferase involved in cellulose biosynthesis
MEESDMANNFVDERELQVEVYENFEELCGLQSEWDAFMESVDAEIFLTFDWCRIWWKFYGKKRRLAIFVFREQNNICAILPLFFETIWLGPISVRAIRIVGADYMPVTVSVPIKKDFINRVVKILLITIEARWRWDILYLGSLCGRYLLADQIVQAFKYALGTSYHYEVESKEVQTYYEVAKDWEHQVAGLASRIRNNARRTYKEISQNNISVCSSLASEEDLSEMFDNFVEMHQNHWQQLGMPGHFGAWPASADFHREVAGIQVRLNRLRLIETKFDDQVVGYEYVYKFNRTYYCFLSARREKEINPRIGYKWISFHEILENALKDSVSCLDSMRGKYDYKLEMGGKYFSIKNLFIYPKTLTSLSRIALFRFFAWFCDMCYSKLWHGRIAPRLGIKRKVYWDNWIRVHPFAY